MTKTITQTEEAWAEVLAQAPDADTPGCGRNSCATGVSPSSPSRAKSSWDLEPWRPAVDDNTMLLAGCNPGGPEKG